jgi:methylmalonyl-CoA mutase, N-terminal domain
MHRPVYRAEDLAGFDPEGDLGYPGQYPFTRGIRPAMYRGRLWTMRQYSGVGDAEQSNQRYKFLLTQGCHGLSVAFDLPTQLGYDSDSPWAAGEVGKAGVAIDSIEDMERLFSGIPLDSVSTSMTINATANILLALYVATARRAQGSGAELTRLSGTVQNDILKEYIARGTYIHPLAPALRLASDLFAWTSQHLPKWNPISISGYHMREAGATAVQEVAFSLANARAYLEVLRQAGLDPGQSAARFSFFFSAHNDFFEEVAKFRAARRLWARLLQEHFGLDSGALRFHAQTAGSTLTAQQAENNLARTALQALSAILGGAQSLHVNGYDEALGLPSEEAALLALRTQQILALESGVAQTVDPLAGSYYLESLTTSIEQEACSYLERIDALGGMVAAIERGWVQREIEDAAYRHQQAVDAGETVVVGVNRFTSPDDSPCLPDQDVDEAAERRQIERVRALRAHRDPLRWRAALDRVTEQARSAGNLMPVILDAVESYATVGEIAGSLRQVFGEYHPMPPR